MEIERVIYLEEIRSRLGGYGVVLPLSSEFKAACKKISHEHRFTNWRQEFIERYGEEP